jgi:hypothetical protein
VGAALQFFRFEPTEVRNPVDAENRVQLAEVKLYFHEVALSYAGATALSAGGSPPGETPDKAIDGDVNTKWLNDQLDVDASISIQLAQVAPLTGYTLVTANDADARDPVAWRLEGALDGSSYVLLHEVASGGAAGGAAMVPLDRMTESSSFYLDIPCVAPTSVADLSCTQGNLIGHGQICTAVCAGSVGIKAIMPCDQGILTPDPETLSCP